MTPEQNKRLNDWLENRLENSAGGASTENEIEQEICPEWEIQSSIDTLLRMQENQLALSGDFHEKLTRRIEAVETLLTLSSESNQTAESETEPSQVEGRARHRLSSTSADVRRPVRWWQPALALALAGVLIVAWQAFANRYPDPQATGAFQIVGGGALQSDSTLVTNNQPAQVVLGGYCHVTVKPDSHVTLAGDKRDEGIDLESGSVVCEVNRGKGKFKVFTDFGTVSVVGTKFEVEIREEGTGEMKVRQMIVNVLVGTVLVTTAKGQTTTLHAGEKTVVGSNAEDFTAGGYQLVWSDEFTEEGPPDPKNWAFEEGFVRNNEAQWYQKENAQCKNGKLYITGREDIKRNPAYVKGSTDPKETKFIEYTSSSLMTKGLHSWTMGRFVMRAKIPHGEGMWPAFWAVGENGEWPSNGDIDIMEYYQNKILANVASGTAKRWNANWNSKSILTKDLGGDKWLDEFHVWRMDWDTEAIRIYVDDKLLNETKLENTYNSNLKWGPKNPFHHPHYIIVNHAMGGDNGGDMEKAKIPAEFIIDYVRVYQRDEDRNFKPTDKYVPPPQYTGKKVGIHHFSELPKTVNKKCSWENGADSRCYAWKSPGSDRESAAMIADEDDKLEGATSYKFVLNSGWSRWIVEMDPTYGDGVADFSGFAKMGFAIKSKDASKWESFRVIIESANGKSYEAPLESLGFKPDGQWHRCLVDLKDVKKSGVDLAKIKTLFAIGWEGGVSNGQYFKLDDLYLE